jgi:hypothetical protein
MNGVDHHLEQGQAFWRNPNAAADHDAVIGSLLQLFFKHIAPGFIGCDHAGVTLPSAFSDLRHGYGNASVDLLRIETWRQCRVGEVYGFGLLADEQYTGISFLRPFGSLSRIARLLSEVRYSLLDASESQCTANVAVGSSTAAPPGQGRGNFAADNGHEGRQLARPRWANFRREQSQQKSLFDHLVGPSKQRGRNINTYRFGRFQVDRERELDT